MKNTQKFLEKLWPFDFLAYFANALIHKYLRQNNYIWTLFYFQTPISNASISFYFYLLVT